MKAMLWDRDGILNHVLEHRQADGEKNVSPQKFEDFKMVQDAKEVLEYVHKLGYLNIVHTNQPDISRSKMSWEELNKMNDFLKAELPIAALYVCPHDRKDNCSCRKPEPGMLLDAAKDYKLDLSQCYTVGDSGRDIEAGIKAGTKNILLRTEYNKDFIYPGQPGVEFRETGSLPEYFEVQSLREILNIVK